MAPRRKRPVPVVLNPTEGSKFKEETILVSLTETNISVVVVGKTGSGQRSRYPRKTLVDLDVTNVDQINSLFEAAATATANKTTKKTAAKNGRKKTAKKPESKTRKKPGPTPKKVAAKKARKKSGPKPKKVAAKKAATRKKSGPKPKKANGTNGKKTAAPKKTAKKTEKATPPKRTRKEATTKMADPWGDEEWGN